MLSQPLQGVGGNCELSAEFFWVLGFEFRVSSSVFRVLRVTKLKVTELRVRVASLKGNYEI